MKLLLLVVGVSVLVTPSVSFVLTEKSAEAHLLAQSLCAAHFGRGMRYWQWMYAVRTPYKNSDGTYEPNCAKVCTVYVKKDDPQTDDKTFTCRGGLHIYNRKWNENSVHVLGPKHIILSCQSISVNFCCCLAT